MFGGGKSFGGLGAGRPLDPAAEIQRLLNQHAAHWIALGEGGPLCCGSGERQQRGGPARCSCRCCCAGLRIPRSSFARQLAASPTAPLTCAEKEIKEVKAKQEKAYQAYAVALEAKEKARSALLAAERGASEAEAALEHCRVELESSKVGGARDGRWDSLCFWDVGCDGGWLAAHAWLRLQPNWVSCMGDCAARATCVPPALGGPAHARLLPGLPPTRVYICRPSTPSWRKRWGSCGGSAPT